MRDSPPTYNFNQSDHNQLERYQDKGAIGQHVSEKEHEPMNDIFHQEHHQQQQKQQQELQRQLENEQNTISQLRQQLQDKQEIITQMQARSQAQQIQFNLQTATLRNRLRRKEQEIKSVVSQHENCVSTIISHLLFLEGEMKKEQAEAIGTIRERDDVIRCQNATIAELMTKNERLLYNFKQSTPSSDYDVITGNSAKHRQAPLGSMPASALARNAEDQDNKSVLRGNNKALNGFQSSSSGLSSHRLRFNSMKERLRRHKSSLELYQTEPLEPLVEGTLRYFGSQENLVDGGMSSLHGPGMNGDERKQRCRSWIEVDPGGLDGYTFPQETDENHKQSPDSCFGEESSSEKLGSVSYSCYPSTDGKAPSYARRFNTRIGYGNGSTVAFNTGIGLHELSKSRSVPHALPTVVEKDSQSVGRSSRDRPHSIPSSEFLTGDLTVTKTAMEGVAVVNTGKPKVSMSSNDSLLSQTTPVSHHSTSASLTSHPAPQQQTNTPSSTTTPQVSESNPFKSFKNVFKRRGSKKKRSVSLGQATNQEYQDSLKQHFKKYDLS